MKPTSQTRVAVRSNHTSRLGRARLSLLLCGVALAASIYLGSARNERGDLAQAAAAPAPPRVVAATPEAAGRYLVLVGGCNDCHTTGFMEKAMAVPEAEWLTGAPLGWRGPWGTTYASNLRLYFQNYDENTFVQAMHIRNARPPMPWLSINSMSDEDLGAIYRYIKSLPPKGEKVPDFVPDGQEPKTPFIRMVPEMVKAK